MMKRLYITGYLFSNNFLFQLSCIVKLQAQDTTKKAPEEKKVTEEKSAPAKSSVAATPSKAKPVTHYYGIKCNTGGYPQRQVGLFRAATSTRDHGKKANAKSQIDPAQLNAKSLTGQYQYLLTKTYNYQQPLISALWKNFTDTLGETRTKLKAAQTKAASQSKLVDSLKALSASKEQTLNESNAKADAISLFGIMMAKSTYNLVMFGLVIVLAIALFIVIATTAKNKHEAKYRTELYDELDEEFKAFKAKANEKELKLARELQTERNKLDELMGRG